MEGCLTLWGFPLFFPAPESNFPFPPGRLTPGHPRPPGVLAPIEDSAQAGSLGLGGAKASLSFAPGGYS